jgi:ubiquinone/menaquinone biosynthesis C-methylase UbiE
VVLRLLVFIKKAKAVNHKLLSPVSFSDPQHNIDQFMLGEGMEVADLGAGPGMYTLAAAKAVGSEGRVYAIDVQRDLLPKIKHSAHEHGLYNVEVLWGDIERRHGTKLRDNVVDAAIVSNVLFQVEDKKAFIEEVKRIVKPRGKVLVVDWSDSFGGMGPPPGHVVHKEDIRQLFEESGFSYEGDISAGAHHWGMILRKSA